MEGVPFSGAPVMRYNKWIGKRLQLLQSPFRLFKLCSRLSYQVLVYLRRFCPCFIVLSSRFVFAHRSRVFIIKLFSVIIVRVIGFPYPFVTMILCFYFSLVVASAFGLSHSTVALCNRVYFVVLFRFSVLLYKHFCKHVSVSTFVGSEYLSYNSW